jgi:hypothetical protein
LEALAAKLEKKVREPILSRKGTEVGSLRPTAALSLDRAAELN